MPPSRSPDRIETTRLRLNGESQERSLLMKYMRHLALAGVLALVACVPKRDVPPPPPEQPEPARPSPPAPPPPPADWRDIALTPGAWVYRSGGDGSAALFGVANSEAQFSVRCDRSRRRIMLSREGATTGQAMTIRTSFGARSLPVTVQREPLAYSTATLAASDPILDGMAFSRGRFTVEAPGLPMLVIPAWPEPARVVEDCRA
jgi:hypothetical protein